MVDPPVFRYPEATVFWVAFIWLYAVEIMHSGIVRGAPPGNTQDAGTLRLINSASDLAQLSAFLVSFLPYGLVPSPLLALLVGTVLLIAGRLFRRHCIGILGKYRCSDGIPTASHSNERTQASPETEVLRSSLSFSRQVVDP